jgi:hypothetical protein
MLRQSTTPQTPPLGSYSGGEARLDMMALRRRQQRLLHRRCQAVATDIDAIGARRRRDTRVCEDSTEAIITRSMTPYPRAYSAIKAL